MREIRFVSYVPRSNIVLCHGVLTLSIDGENIDFEDIIVTTGYSGFPNGYDHEPVIVTGPWEFSEITECEGKYKIKDNEIWFTKAELDYILYLINNNIEWGCCGACI